MMRYDLIDLLFYFEIVDNAILPVSFEGKYIGKDICMSQICNERTPTLSLRNLFARII